MEPGEAMPRRLLFAALVIIGTLGAVEATPKEVVVGLATDPLSASPLSTLPTGTSLLLEELRREGYDVRVYADANDLLADSYRELAVIVVGPEAVSQARARIVVEALEAAYRGFLIVADEKPVSTGSAHLLVEAARRACGLTLHLAAGGDAAILVVWTGSGVRVAQTVTYAGLGYPSLKTSFMPVPPVTLGAVNITAFASPQGTVWYPAGLQCRGHGLTVAFLGDSDVARNAALKEDPAGSLAVELVRGVVGPPRQGLVLAFIVAFYTSGPLSLKLVIHPSYVLSVVAQAYVALEPRLLSALSGPRLQALLAGLTLALASTFAGAAGRLAAGRRGRRGAPWARLFMEACARGARHPACRGGLWGLALRLYYSLAGWDRAYKAILPRSGHSGPRRGAG